MLYALASRRARHAQCAADEPARRDAWIRACAGPTESYHATRTNGISKVRIALD